GPLIILFREMKHRPSLPCRFRSAASRPDEGMSSKSVVNQNTPYLADGVNVHGVRQHEPVIGINQPKFGQHQVQQSRSGGLDFAKIGFRFFHLRESRLRLSFEANRTWQEGFDSL